MRYIVTGANRQTGKDSQLILSAASVEEAERLATQKGLLVASVRPATSGTATDVGTDPLPIWDEDPTTAAAGPVTAPPARTARPPSESPAVSPTPATSAALANAPSAASAGSGDAPSRDAVVPASALYHVIQNPALYLLETAVNKHMKEGWDPLGGIQVSYATNQLLYYQAMVRRKPGGQE